MQLPYTMSVSIGAYAVPPTSPETFEQAIIKVDEIKALVHSTNLLGIKLTEDEFETLYEFVEIKRKQDPDWGKFGLFE